MVFISSIASISRRAGCSKTKQKGLWREGKPLGNLELKEKSGTEPARTESGLRGE